MRRYILGITFAVAGASALWAGEHVVEAEHFEKTVALEGSVLPEKTHSFRIEPKAWESFRILEVVEQGAEVKKGEAMVVIDTEDLDQRLTDEQEAAKIRDLELAAVRRELADLEVQTPRALEAAKRAFQRAREDLQYFKTTGREVRAESARKAAERAERNLEYQQEELDQLLKMYQEDDLTEETEEIILKRQRNAVADSEHFLERSRISLKKTLETDLPRESEDLAIKLKDAELNWSTKKETLPRALAQKHLDVKKATEDHRRAGERLAELREDRKLMEIVAPESGRIYYGEIADGRWNPGQTAKYLKRGGSLPGQTNFATLVPQGAGMRVHTDAQEGQLQALRVGQKGYFAPKSAPRARVPAELVSVASHPNLAGTYPVVFKLEGAVEGLVAGMKGTVRLVAHSREGALTVPVSALVEKSDGTLALRVKAAGEEGDGEERTVEVGPESEGKIVVTSGLQAGEVVVTEDAQQGK